METERKSEIGFMDMEGMNIKKGYNLCYCNVDFDFFSNYILLYS